MENSSAHSRSHWLDLNHAYLILQRKKKKQTNKNTHTHRRLESLTKNTFTLLVIHFTLSQRMLLTFYFALQFQSTTLSMGGFILKKWAQKPQALPHFCSKNSLNIFCYVFLNKQSYSSLIYQIDYT